VIEALRTSILEPRDHLHIKQMSELDTGPGERVCALGVSGSAAEMSWIWLPAS